MDSAAEGGIGIVIGQGRSAVVAFEGDALVVPMVCPGLMVEGGDVEVMRGRYASVEPEFGKTLPSTR